MARTTGLRVVQLRPPTISMAAPHRSEALYFHPLTMATIGLDMAVMAHGVRQEGISCIEHSVYSFVVVTLRRRGPLPSLAPMSLSRSQPCLSLALE